MEKLPHDINELDSRIDTLKKRGIKKESSSSWGKYVAPAFRIATEFVAPVFIGLCMGYVLDKLFHTKAVFLLLLSLLGCAAGMLNVYRAAQNIEKSMDEE